MRNGPIGWRSADRLEWRSGAKEAPSYGEQGMVHAQSGAPSRQFGLHGHEAVRMVLVEILSVDPPQALQGVVLFRVVREVSLAYVCTVC